MTIIYILIAILVFFLVKDIKIFLICVVVTYPTLFLIPNIGSISFISVLSYCSLVYCILFPHKQYLDQNDSFPFKTSISLCLLSYLITSLFNPFSLKNFINSTSDFILLYSLWYLLKPSMKLKTNFALVLTIYMAFLCLYGLYEAVSGENPIIQDLVGNGRVEDIYNGDNSHRTGLFRTKSLTIWSEVYGTICCTAMFFYMNMFIDIKFKYRFLVFSLLFLLAFGVLSTNSRTIWVAAVIILTSTILDMRRNSHFYILLFCIVILFMHDYFIDTIIDPLININSSGGSSLDMRVMQYKASILATHNIWFGNGIFAYSKAQKIFSDLYGVESIVFTTLIDRGIFGLITLFYFWLDVLLYIIKKSQFKLLFLFGGYMFIKISTLAFGLSEAYMLMFVILWMRVERAKLIRTIPQLRV